MNKEKAIWLFAGGQMQESAAKKIVEGTAKSMGVEIKG